uniref:Putative glycosyltransferase, TIGR04372 family n=1 Tax=Candidatus Kentrum sp. FM TaxID=2126340 RepID=A0A450TPL8_9GAMM|nr:MAG: putative glycosyltransferase, TIGR04372 family [Candidatus Kentron sp. FM]VFJ69921.1 MAG: putative glycosyltransferase, TIGR04372 family [Candidatus Kentron sp. FM]VFK17492.1 MAG: putative glycosyltransferase, TIGR04372 family [Candidatus Kentron sp. FM]
MNPIKFFTRESAKIRKEGLSARMRRWFKDISRPFLIVLAIPPVLIIRIIRPWKLIRFCALSSAHIGHFAANTELYLCERDAGINLPDEPHVDIFYPRPGKSICNRQLTRMWKRVLRVWPTWIADPMVRVNRLIPGGEIHRFPVDSWLSMTPANTQHDRDVHNLLDRFPPHLGFTEQEEARGSAGLRAMGIPEGARFICMMVRDSTYWPRYGFSSYRDSNVQNYVLAAEELANRGYYVLRMGAKVREAIKSHHGMVIDYATNGMRTDFMDIYIGAKCHFCISTGTGFDEIPEVFRRPIAYVNYVPLGLLRAFSKDSLTITKHHRDSQDNRELSIGEILSREGFSLSSEDYASKGILFRENSPEEIRDLAIEMAKRLDGTWQPEEGDEELQRRFWALFPSDAPCAYNGKPLHGEIRGRFGAVFLRNNPDWLR